MSITKIKKQFARTESMLRSADSQRVHLWNMLLPYMSKEFYDEFCYIDVVAYGGDLVVVYNERSNFVRYYPVSQIIDLIEEGVTCITPDQLIAI
nr:MAG TPA: hypothetical protein [Herelleviridae sp.]